MENIFKIKFKVGASEILNELTKCYRIFELVVGLNDKMQAARLASNRNE